MTSEVKITTGAWYGDKEVTLSFPDNWDISVYGSKGAEALDDSEIAATFAKPIGTKRIEQLARGRKNAVIIVDDLSRPTPAELVIPHIIEELKEGGISEESICFVIGGGSHRPLTEEEMAKKIGEAVSVKHEIHNHNVFSKSLEDLGQLEDGTPVHINEIVFHSDLRIAIGGIIPHGSVGLGGGGKIILPGVAGYDTIAHNHSGPFKGRGRGNLERRGEEKDMRDNAEDVARHLGLDFMVNIVLTGKREIAGLFMGDVIESHRQGALFAKEIYDTPIPKEEVEATDIVIINSYPQDSDPVQLGKSMWPSGVFKNAQKVAINPASDGIMYHGMGDKMDYDAFLKMKANEPEPTDIPENGEIKSKEDFVLLSSGYIRGEFYKRYPSGALFEDWGDLVDQLKRLHHEAKVAIIPYSPIQLPNII
ncbi:lactate racemase domain-containing protein [Candidatus Poribacteria bacterium]